MYVRMCVCVVYSRCVVCGIYVHMMYGVFVWYMHICVWMHVCMVCSYWLCVWCIDCVGCVHVYEKCVWHMVSVMCKGCVWDLWDMCICMHRACVLWGERDVCIVWSVPIISTVDVWYVCVVCVEHVCVHAYTWTLAVVFKPTNSGVRLSECLAPPHGK